MPAPEVPNRLKKILEVKETEIAKLLPRLDHLRHAAAARNDFVSLLTALDREGLEDPGLALLAEVKKASPSAGVIAADFDPVAIARAYEAGGAHAVSVLTDEPFFQGHNRFLVEIRSAIGLPILRKDFTIHEVQIYEASLLGADAILLIVAALDDKNLHHLFEVAERCQLDALVEVHTLEEMDRALDLGARLIGINNRDLTTFEVDLKTTEILSEEVPDDVVLVSESGLRSRADAQRALACGCDAILVGEALMRTGDIAGQIAELLGKEPGTSP